jgi:hypothetical protein
MTKAETILGGFVAGAAEAGLKFHCYRCGEALTDPASTEAGIGPVCRKLANAALATTIPADIDTVLAHLAGVSFKAEALTEALAAVTEEITEGAAKGRADWRNVANVLVRLIAYSTLSSKAALCNAVEALGYVTLAAVAREEASPSTAEVTVADCRVVLKTKKNAAALAAIKAIPGRKFHGESKTWSFPPTEFRAVLAVVQKFFPVTKLNVLDLATEVAKAVNASKPAAVTTTVNGAPVKAAPSVTITEAPGGFNVVSPYNPAFVADLKTALPYKARAWTGKCWWVAATVVDTVKEIAAKHYGADAIAA